MEQEKKPRKTDAETLELLQKLRPIDDAFFEKVIEDPDAYVEGEEDRVFNIEVQKHDDDDHVRRIRYNASAITVDRSEPGDHFKDVQDVYVIYISSFDVLENGLTISHAEMTCVETGEPVGDGMYEIYVNTEIKDGSRVSRLMDDFTKTEMEDTEFPRMSERVNKLKHDPKEVQGMCELLEEYAEKRAERAAKEAAKTFAQKLLANQKLTYEEISECTGLSIEEIKTLRHV